MNFDGFARFYDGDYRDYTADIPLVLATAQAAGSAGLELGCGTGRVLLPLAQAGFTVTGIDGSPALLALARRKAQAAGLAERIELVQADMRHFRLPRQGFDFAFAVSNTLMHLTTQADQLAALKTAARHLRPGGVLLLDLFHPDIAYLESVAGVQELADQWQDTATGAQVLKWTTRHLDVARQLQETVFIYEEIFPDGRSSQTTFAFSLRFWWPSEGALLLEKAGFAVTDLLGDFDGSSYGNGSERLIFRAQKL